MATVCVCGCGQALPPARRSRGGRPARFILGHQARTGRSRKSDGQGYVQIHAPAHPRANSEGYVYEHVLVAERALGRPLSGAHPVHHVNEDRADNRPSNLVICQDNAYHVLLHRRAKALAACGHADWIICVICHQYGAPETMRIEQGSGRHPACRNAYQRARTVRQREARAAS